MKQHIENARRHLGELGAMAAQTEAAERKILARAQSLLSEVEGKIEEARAGALTSDEGGEAYTDLIEERGRLLQVIANAEQALRGE